MGTVSDGNGQGALEHPDRPRNKADAPACGDRGQGAFGPNRLVLRRATGAAAGAPALPVSSPRVAPNRAPGLRSELYTPRLSTVAKRSSRLPLGTRTLVNRMAPLSIPLSPTLYPQSRMSTPGTWADAERGTDGRTQAWASAGLCLPNRCYAPAGFACNPSPLGSGINRAAVAAHQVAS